MINTNKLMIEKKVDYIVREVIMGNRTEYDFNRHPISTNKSGKLVRYLYNINSNNYRDYVHYLVEMGYINAFHQDNKVGKKLRAWYQMQMKHLFKCGYIQLFCILYARSKPIFEKHGESEAIEINYFDVITNNYVENLSRYRYWNIDYNYMLLSEYAAVISKIVEVWMAASPEKRATQTRPEFKTWLENEKDFFEKMHLVEKKNDVVYGWQHQSEREEYENRKDKLLSAIEEAVQLFDKDVNCKM